MPAFLISFSLSPPFIRPRHRSFRLSIWAPSKLRSTRSRASWKACIDLLLRGVLPPGSEPDLPRTIRRLPDLQTSPVQRAMKPPMQSLARVRCFQRTNSRRRWPGSGPITDQQDLESIVNNLALYDTMQATSVRLDDVHYGYHLLVTRKLLNLTLNEEKSHKYAKISDCEKDGHLVTIMPKQEG